MYRILLPGILDFRRHELERHPPGHDYARCRAHGRGYARKPFRLSAFPRVTVYDNGSTDRTVELCEAFPNTHISQGEFFGFGPTYNHAADLAPGEWIRSIHADERLSEELAASLAGLELDDPAAVYAFERHNSDANGSFFRHMKRYVGAEMSKEPSRAGREPTARSSPRSAKADLEQQAPGRLP